MPGGQKLKAIDATVPGDISSAAFFLCAALLFPESNLILDSIGMNPTRAALLDVIAALGGRIKVLNVEEQHGELIGTIQVNSCAGRVQWDCLWTIISGALSAQIIDELPVIAAIAPYTRDGITIRDAKELRVKESDRIALVAKNLRAMGAELTEFEDGLSGSGWAEAAWGGDRFGDGPPDCDGVLDCCAAGERGDGDSWGGGCGDFVSGVLYDAGCFEPALIRWADVDVHG